MIESLLFLTTCRQKLELKQNPLTDGINFIEVIVVGLLLAVLAE